jgi:anti-sigma-K factor RskA
MTSHDEFAAAAATYALDPGALGRDARLAFEAHLETCDQCRADVAAFRRVGAGIGLGVDAVSPPESLKARTLARATSQPQERSATAPRTGTSGPSTTRAAAPAWWLLAAAAAALVATGLYAFSMREQVQMLRQMVADASSEARSLRAELADVRRDSVRLTRALAVVSAPDLIRANLSGQATAAAATGRAFWSRSQGLVFSADRLPALPAGRVYQLWVLAPGPVSVGVLSVSATGTTTFSAALPADLPPIAAVAVTAEPGPNGSTGPTTPILLVGKPGS